MDRITLKTKDLSNSFEFDGISLADSKKDLSSFFGIPMALANVDEKFETNTFKTVLEKAAPTIDILVKDNNVQVLDPRSQFLSDEAFERHVEKLRAVGDVEISDSNFEKVAKVTMKPTDEDNFLGDLYTHSIAFTRRGEGGVNFNIETLRLACTNGAQVQDKEFVAFLRNPEIQDELIKSFVDKAESFSIKKYLDRLFTADGVPVGASVSDMTEMYDLLKNRTDDSTADVLFPLESVTKFYADQDIDITKLPRKYLDKLPAGMSYYQCFNILTNGVKLVKDLTLNDKINVGRFIRPSRLKQMKEVDLHWEGTPTFSQEDIAHRMGDL